jgi:hypothetical protein
MSVNDETAADAPLRLFVCGDVMTGRGIDQILPTIIQRAAPAAIALVRKLVG